MRRRRVPPLKPRSIMLLEFGRRGESGMRADQCDATEEDIKMHDVVGLLESKAITVEEQKAPEPAKTKPVAHTYEDAVASEEPENR